LRRLLDEGETTWSTHAEDELRKDGLTMIDAVNVIRGGVVEEAEFENGSWRHRVRTPRITVVVAFDGDEDTDTATEIVVVTAWRNR
jgi:hypothetical protein